MRKNDSKRLREAADFADSAASELASAAATLEEEGDEVVAYALRNQARTHRVQAIQLRARAGSEAVLCGAHSGPRED